METYLHISKSAWKLFAAGQMAIASTLVWSATPTGPSGTDEIMVAPVSVREMI